MRCINPDKFKLNHHDLDRFHRSEWTDPGVYSTWYVIYRVVLAVLMGVGVVAHVYLNTPSPKWLIYMTDQGITLLAIHYVLHAFLVLWAKCRRPKSDGRTLPFLYKLSWGLENMVSTIALLISILYWTLLHPTVVEYGFLKTPLDEFMNFFMHAINTISYFVDFFISGRPKRIHHFYFAIIFGLWYACFSVIYWAAGGLSRCAVRCISLNTTRIDDITETAVRHGMCEPQICDKIVCDDFIYPITDWSCTPWTTVGLIFGAMLFGVPVGQLFWWALYKLRMWFSGSCGSARFSKESVEPLRTTREVHRTQHVAVM